MGLLLPDPDRLGVGPLLKIRLEKFLRNGMSPISGILGKKTLRISSKSYTVIFYLKLIILRTYAKKPGFYSKSLFLIPNSRKVVTVLICQLLLCR